jgi:hypothetical protein
VQGWTHLLASAALDTGVLVDQRVQKVGLTLAHRYRINRADILAGRTTVAATRNALDVQLHSQSAPLTKRT